MLGASTLLVKPPTAHHNVAFRFVAGESVVLHPSPATTVGEAKEQVAGALGVLSNDVDLKDATGRCLHNNGATFEQYRAQLPIEGSEARGLRGGMPPKQGTFLCMCALS